MTICGLRSRKDHLRVEKEQSIKVILGNKSYDGHDSILVHDQNNYFNNLTMRRLEVKSYELGNLSLQVH